MADRNITHVDIFRGRDLIVRVKDDQAAEVIALTNIKDGIVSLTEEPKESVYEVEDGTEIENPYARKLIFEFSFSELVEEDIAALYAPGGSIEIETSLGGANGTGKILTVAGCSSIYGFIDDLKTKIIARKTVAGMDTLPYEIEDNAA